MVKHLLDLVHRISRFFMKYLCHQIFQQMSYLQLNPVAVIIQNYSDALFVIVDIPAGTKGGNTKNRAYIAAANTTPAVLEPFFSWKIRCIHHDQRLITVTGFRTPGHINIPGAFFWEQPLPAQQFCGLQTAEWVS